MSLRAVRRTPVLSISGPRIRAMTVNSPLGCSTDIVLSSPSGTDATSAATLDVSMAAVAIFGLELVRRVARPWVERWIPGGLLVALGTRLAVEDA